MCRIINLIDKTSKAAVRLIISNASMFPLRIKTKTYYLILEYKHLSNTSAKTIKTYYFVVIFSFYLTHLKSKPTDF